MSTQTPPPSDQPETPDASGMATRYDPVAVEDTMRARWDAAKAFEAGGPDDPRETFTIIIPPPNVTGVLHMGHALNGTLQDIVARHRRMSGFDTLWVPGTDHAGIATQAVVEKKLYAEEGKTREDLGRDAFLERIWAWKEEHGNKILEQFKHLGASCDWSRTAFTLDPGLSHAVRVAFVKLWEQKLIYRGARLVNWDCVLQTAVSDDEIEYVAKRSQLHYLRYPLADDASRHLVVATTRPETMLADTGVAVHPDDKRYADLVGKKLRLPLVDREIPIVADDSVDSSFGTGAVKVTPGHDPADYERGARHRLPIINLLEKDGSLNENGGPFAGLPREKARKQVLAAMKEQGLLEKSEDIDHKVPVSDRSKSPIEPLVSEQWFVKMKPLAQPALKAVESGALTFKPARWTKVYRDWLEKVHDWCISRQLWWGHRIPVWYDEDNEPAASVTDLELGAPHPTTGKPLVRRDDDVLDTWASSWLFPMATLGWPENTPDLQRYYPTQFLSTASDIIYLWVARMVMAGYAFMDELDGDAKNPFTTCYIHATVLDATGQRMSKSKGNGIDPLDMIAQYGADAVRFSLVMLTKEGQDTKLAPEKFEMGRNFVNKLWNAARFVLGKAGKLPALELSKVDALEDRWILSRLAATCESVHGHYERYEFNDAATTLYRFVWNDVCDWYVEAVKTRLESGDRVAAAVLGRVLGDMLGLLHPLAPFVTEAIWEKLRAASEYERPELLATAPFPRGEGLARDPDIEAALDDAQEIVGSVRKLRQQNNVSESKPAKVTVALTDAAPARALPPAEEFMRRLGNFESLVMGKDPERPAGAAVDFAGGSPAAFEVLLDLEGLVDREAQKADLSRNLAKLEKQLASIQGKLGNEGFVAKAPAEVVERERARLTELEAERARLQALLAAL
ncbi:MAG: valine--tRNA ligase [Planctomycetota bacterium]|nr:MAG: valine--tRNA ligase [Planctomycetota bacterium]